MIQLSPFALRTAMRLDELDESGKRAAYMAIEEMHRLQTALAEEQKKNHLMVNDNTKNYHGQLKN